LKFLIDECLHTSVLQVAYDAGYEAYHVNHRAKSGAGDEELIRIALAEELTIVTNNAGDFRRLMSRTNAHPGLIVILPNVKSEVQRALFGRALEWIAAEKLSDLINKVVEVDFADGVRIYDLPELT
jgi:predicted nuclease of predicted toxin-antitoxin system